MIGIDYTSPSLPIWNNQVYNMYKVYVNDECLWPTDRIDASSSVCHETFGGKEFAELLTHSKLTKPEMINFDNIHKIKVSHEENGHFLVIEDQKKGEHFIAADNIRLLKGFNYLVFETEPTVAQLYLYIVKDNASLFLKWLDKTGVSGTSWVNMINDEIKPVFSQIESTKDTEKLTVVLYCDHDQEVQIRWQHGHKHRTMYKGKKNNFSTIYKAEIGQIVPM